MHGLRVILRSRDSTNSQGKSRRVGICVSPSYALLFRSRVDLANTGTFWQVPMRKRRKSGRDSRPAALILTLLRCALWDESVVYWAGRPYNIAAALRHHLLCGHTQEGRSYMQKVVGLGAVVLPFARGWGMLLRPTPAELKLGAWSKAPEWLPIHLMRERSTAVVRGKGVLVRMNVLCVLLFSFSHWSRDKSPLNKLLGSSSTTAHRKPTTLEVPCSTCSRTATSSQITTMM